MSYFRFFEKQNMKVKGGKEKKKKFLRNWLLVKGEKHAEGREEKR